MSQKKVNFAMRYIPSAAIFMSFYIALVFGFVPSKQSGSCILNIWTERSAGMYGVMQSHRVVAKGTAKSTTVDRIHMNVRRTGDRPDEINIDDLWRTARKTFATLAMIPLLLGGKQILSYHNYFFNRLTDGKFFNL